MQSNGETDIVEHLVLYLKYLKLKVSSKLLSLPCTQDRSMHSKDNDYNSDDDDKDDDNNSNTTTAAAAATTTTTATTTTSAAAAAPPPTTADDGL